MAPDRQQGLTRLIGWTFFASFWLPLDPIAPFGAWVCVMTLIAGVRMLVPALLIAWSANPLFVVGLLAFRTGRYRRAAGFGGAALVASLPAGFYLADPIQMAVSQSSGTKLLFLSGYFVWMLALIGLTVISTLAALGQAPHPFRPQFRLGRGMIAVAIVALALAVGPAFFFRVLFLSWW